MLATVQAYRSGAMREVMAAPPRVWRERGAPPERVSYKRTSPLAVPTATRQPSALALSDVTVEMADGSVPRHA